MESAYEIAKMQLSAAAKVIDLDPNILEKLSNPTVHKRELIIDMDDGSKKSFAAFRSQHNNALGPYKGGIRFHQNVSEDEVKALSIWMTWKTSLVGLPLGGAKGGIIVNPKELSKNELQKLSRQYARQFADVIGPNIDIPAPDVNTTPQIMAWMLDEYENVVGHKAPGAFTGKPIDLGGSLGREEATGRGGYFTVVELAKILQLDPKNTTVAIQGIGNVGYYVAHLLKEHGFKVVAMSDSNTALFNENGMSPYEIKQCKINEGSLNKCVIDSFTKQITNDDLLELDVDILIPAALENQITSANADKIKAKYIVELANGPVTFDAEKILSDKQKLIVPDVLANSGGVIVSYFEWVQNNMGYYWTEKEVNDKLKPLIVDAFHKVYNYSKENNLTLRNAAYTFAIKRVAKAMFLRN